MDERATRRHVLRVGAVAVGAGVAGCLGDGDDDSADDTPAESSDTPDDSDGGDDERGDGTSTPADDTEDDDDTEDTGDEDVDGTESDTGDGATTIGDGDEASTNPESLDLQEANVVEVAFEDSDGSVRFDVALHHDDDGEDGYANWWQVERLDGTQLGRRDLLHPHSQQPFTRSETIDVPDDVRCVVVRGHDQTHAYGGVAMLVNLDTGATRAVDQGTDPDSFDRSDCP
jgi:hypothetical protein